MKPTGQWLLPDDANVCASVPLAPLPLSSVIPTFLICHPDRSEMIRNADRFAEWRDLLLPSLWWKPKHLRMLAPWACHQLSCAHLRGSTGLQAGELPSLPLSS